MAYLGKCASRDTRNISDIDYGVSYDIVQISAQITKCPNMVFFGTFMCLTLNNLP
jgi:hypothetical protein